ncbi:hypothetical protein Aca07nite_56830 [Actinoplanes capillaceus]|uniref:Uncharacterized protein n=1 Tax=Actinoplanes campanulatus TaxID=113559 RepID=A0ABQ3WQE0_9ACTN|nr:hypothetical protein [Actinoplanes capillaceus]GID48408.1 hypothetical protein Aca07nite_56830 [Actinoplanes capillaceus]
MGLFRTAELDPALADVLATSHRRARKALAKGQDGVHKAVLPGERIVAVTVDDLECLWTIVLTEQRLLTMTRGGEILVRETGIAEVPGATVEHGKHYSVLVLDRMSLRLHFENRAEAGALAKQINELVVANRPRTIPALHPGLYATLLSRAGVPETAVNRARLAERTAVVLGAQAVAMTAQFGDPDAFAEFTHLFARVTPGREQQRADDMISWLWEWHPLTHQTLTRQLATWQDGLLQPDSFLTAAAGGEIPPWSDGPGDDTETWRVVYRRNQRT